LDAAFSFFAPSLSKGKALSLISHCRKEKGAAIVGKTGTSMAFLLLHPQPPKDYLIAEKKRHRLHHETNYPQSKIFQSSNLPIFQSSGG
jgi:hypothetical protein